jgi:hypothetical protein
VRPVFEPRRDLAVPIPVELTRRNGSRRTEYAVNLSPGGLCLHLPRPIAVGEVVELAFAIPASAAGAPADRALPDQAGERIVARGRVIWAEGRADGTGGGRVRFTETGVRFEGLAEPHRLRILDFVREGS